MKFGKQVRSQIHQPWADFYLPYNRFKRVIKRYVFSKSLRTIDREAYIMKREKSRVTFASIGEESSPLMGEINGDNGEASHLEYGSLRVDRSSSVDARIERQLSEEERSASSKMFLDMVEESLPKVNQFYLAKARELDGELIAFETRSHLRNSWSVPSGNTYKRLCDTFVEIQALNSFVMLNSEGYRKIVKKFDKVVGTHHSEAFLQRVEQYDFYHSAVPLTLEQRIQALLSRDKLLEMKQHVKSGREGGLAPLLPALKPRAFLACCVIFALALLFPLPIFHHHAARCFAVLVFATSLWVTEAIPFFVTALAIPILIVFLDVLRRLDSVTGVMNMSREDSAELVLKSMVNSTTVLILGGYSISAALSRCEIELRIAAAIQRAFGHQPRIFILSIMLLGMFLSMLISNHTAPVLLSSILIPVVRDCGNGSSFARTLLLGLAFACNFGGMTTPISSMQNVIAWSALKNAGYPVDFGAWLGFAIPFCTLCVLVTWGILIWIMRPTDVQSIPLIIYSCERRLLSARNAIVVALTLMAILLWSTVSITSGMLGDAGIISLLLMVVLFGTGILNEVDFNSFSWHTLWLLGGGNVLGLAVTNSGLLDVIVGGILTDTSHENKWMVALQMVLLTTLTSTFVSHTVCALIIMPIIVQLGQACEMATEFGLMGALACSAGCALPMASFPNVTCLMITDDFNRGYLSAKHFLMNGIPVSLMTIGLIMTFGAFLIVIIAV